jgi:hypothetical protein
VRWLGHSGMAGESKVVFGEVRWLPSLPRIPGNFQIEVQLLQDLLEFSWKLEFEVQLQISQDSLSTWQTLKKHSKTPYSSEPPNFPTSPALQFRKTQLTSSSSRCLSSTLLQSSPITKYLLRECRKTKREFSRTFKHFYGNAIVVIRRCFHFPDLNCNFRVVLKINVEVFFCWSHRRKRDGDGKSVEANGELC